MAVRRELMQLFHCTTVDSNDVTRRSHLLQLILMTSHAAHTYGVALVGSETCVNAIQNMTARPMNRMTYFTLVFASDVADGVVTSFILFPFDFRLMLFISMINNNLKITQFWSRIFVGYKNQGL